MDAAQRPSFSELVHWLYRRLRPMTHDSLITTNTNTISSNFSSNRNIIIHCQSMPGGRFVSATSSNEGSSFKLISNTCLVQLYASLTLQKAIKENSQK